MNSREDYNRIWDNFWKEICTDENGKINLEQIKKELADFSDLMDSASTVYGEVSGISKVNCDAEVIIYNYEIKMEEEFKDWIGDFIEHGKKELDGLDKFDLNGYKDCLNDLKDYFRIDKVDID